MSSTYFYLNCFVHADIKVFSYLSITLTPAERKCVGDVSHRRIGYFRYALDPSCLVVPLSPQGSDKENEFVMGVWSLDWWSYLQTLESRFDVRSVALTCWNESNTRRQHVHPDVLLRCDLDSLQNVSIASLCTVCVQPFSKRKDIKTGRIADDCAGCVTIQPDILWSVYKDFHWNSHHLSYT